MSKAYELNTHLIGIKRNNREDLLSALASIGDCDCDFNGENGIGYAWEETIANGFTSNLEYLLDKVKDIKDDIECINTFIDTWMEKDRNYYYDYQVDYLTDKDANVIVISFAVIVGY